jgi:hypothetical protein
MAASWPRPPSSPPRPPLRPAVLRRDLDPEGVVRAPDAGAPRPPIHDFDGPRRLLAPDQLLGPSRSVKSGVRERDASVRLELGHVLNASGRGGRCGRQGDVRSVPRGEPRPVLARGPALSRRAAAPSYERQRPLHHGSAVRAGPLPCTKDPTGDVRAGRAHGSGREEEASTPDSTGAGRRPGSGGSDAHGRGAPAPLVGHGTAPESPGRGAPGRRGARPRRQGVGPCRPHQGKARPRRPPDTKRPGFAAWPRFSGAQDDQLQPLVEPQLRHL